MVQFYYKLVVKGKLEIVPVKYGELVRALL